MEPSTQIASRDIPWNKGKLVGQKAPAETERYLGHPGTAADRPSHARAMPAATMAAGPVLMDSDND